MLKTIITQNCLIRKKNFDISHINLPLLAYQAMVILKSYYLVLSSLWIHLNLQINEDLKK